MMNFINEGCIIDTAFFAGVLLKFTKFWLSWGRIMNLMDERKGCIMVFFAGMFWGSIGIFVKILKEMGASTGLVSFSRLFFAFILILIFALLSSGVKVLRIDKRTLLCCILMGLFCQTIYNICYTETIDTVGMALGAVLLYTSPVFTAILSRILFKERFNSTKILALLVNIVGCVMAVTGGRITGVVFSAYGIMMGILAALMYTLSAIIARFATDKAGPLTIAVYTFFFALIFIGLFTRPWAEIPGIISPQFILVGALYGLIPTVASYVLYFKGVSHIGETSKVPVLASVEAAVAAMVGVIVFSEGINIGKAVGIVLVILSIYIMNMKRNATTKESAQNG